MTIHKVGNKLGKSLRSGLNVGSRIVAPSGGIIQSSQMSRLKSNLGQSKTGDIVYNVIFNEINLPDTPSWSPQFLTTAFWVDAADGDTITESGGIISEWRDKSGNNRHLTQSTSTQRPSYLSGNTVRFDGIDDRMDTSSTFSVAFYIAVINPYSLSPAYGSLLGFQSKHGVLRDNGTSNWYFSRASLFPDTNTRVGSVLSTVLGSSLNLFSNEGTDQTVGVSLGRDNAGADYGLGDVHEVIVLSTAPTTDIRQKLEGYLAHKWSITANLPGGHPYKTTPPSA